MVFCWDYAFMQLVHLCLFPAAGAESFGFFRFALFVLACGLATLETVAHPFSASLGDERKSEQRINFSQTFNAVGTIIGPLLGGFVILSGVKTGNTQDDLVSVKVLYACIGAVVLFIALAFAFVKVPPLHEHSATTKTDRSYRELFRYRHFRWAAIAQFFNVAAQGGTWALFINYAVKYMPGYDRRKSFVLVWLQHGNDACWPDTRNLFDEFHQTE
jgi:FHS family L-fucose permease-like MFS transporter